MRAPSLEAEPAAAISEYRCRFSFHRPPVLSVRALQKAERIVPELSGRKVEK